MVEWQERLAWFRGDIFIGWLPCSNRGLLGYLSKGMMANVGRFVQDGQCKRVGQLPRRRQNNMVLQSRRLHVSEFRRRSAMKAIQGS